MINVKQHTRKATIWDNLFIELAVVNRTLAIIAEQLAKSPRDLKQAQEYNYWVKKRRELEKVLFRGF
jgi:hypothetical protein